MPSSKSTINIVVQGAAHAGKGSLAAALAHWLTAQGVEVIVQGATSFNQDKMVQPDDQLLARLKDARVIVTEQQTA